MKKSSLLLFALIGVFLLTASAPRTVTSPEFAFAPINFRIEAVHISDTTTRIDAEIYTRPKYWVSVDTNIYLSGIITNRKYPVRRIEGMPMREHVFAGDSARIRATFVFDALVPEDTVFDFIERGGSWNVRGVDLNYRPGGIKTHISGVINDMPSSSWLLLHPMDDDIRANKSIIIPVENGRFEYDLYTDDKLAYDIAVGMEYLNGSWRNNYFFAEGEPVTIDLNDNDEPFWEKIQGGPLTTRLLEFYSMANKIYKTSGLKEERERLDSLKLYYTPEAYDIFTKLEKRDIDPALKDSLLSRFRSLRDSGENLSAYGKELNAKKDSLRNVIEKAKLDFLENDGTLVSLALIMEMVNNNMNDGMDIFKRVYADRYPTHPYTLMLTQLQSDEKPEVGFHYPDFSAPDHEGTVHRLSDLINGKYAVIDLWASWCGSCRRHSMALIPIYEKWKNKGFTVVGIAREGDIRNMEKSIEHDGYPWLNLVELNDSGNIWKKYNAGHQGGKVLFVSPAGIILAINPEAVDIDKILEQTLNKE